jgi:4a-hydroxytetrahydrobiopterin dehydratase
MAARKNLADAECVPCTARTRPLSPARAKLLLEEIPGWSLVRGHLRRTVRFEDFPSLMEFVNDMAELAEEEGHHPDFKVSWARLDLELFTHAIGGLSRNDFILAAKINVLLGEHAA